MKYYNSRITLLVAVLFLAIFNNPLLAQTTEVTKGYGKASYNVTQKSSFMKNWLIAGPVSISNDSLPDNAIQEKAFKEDLLSNVNVAAGMPLSPVHINQNNLPWRSVSSADDVILLDKIYGAKDFVYAYALAEIKADKPTNVMLGVGSDDAVKIWLNGKLVHENFIPRGVKKDDDIIPLKLQRGSNQLLLKVQNMQGGWAFISRILDKSSFADQLTIAAANGNLDKINSLIELGADVNTKNTSGISPITAAKIAGRDDVVQLLIKKGAKDEPVPTAEKIIDAFYTPLKNKEAPGIAILVAKDGKILYKKGFGYADIKGKLLVTPDTKFRIGSVTKQFTAASILKLQENGLLSISDKLSKYIPDFPRGDEVTLYHLLTHSSGIHSYTNKPEFINRVTQTISLDSLINYFKYDPYDFNPGNNFMYNNSGYVLLGYIIQKVSGKPYPQFLKENFFNPLGMKNTGVHYAGIKLENEAHGYESKDGKYDDAINWDMSWAGGAGSLYSTLGDLEIWNEALHSGKVITEKSFKAATTPVVLKGGATPSMNYGYGLMMTKYRGLNKVEHSGGLHGFITQLVYFPKDKLSIVMFSNSDNPEVNFDPNKIAEAYLWDKMDKQSSYKMVAANPHDLKAFTGRYDFMGSAVMSITTEENKLFAQLSGQPKNEIFPSSNNEFFWKVVEAKIKFIKDEKGEVNSAVFTQNGQELTVKKLPEETIIKIDPALLDNYTGRYKFVNNMVVTIFKEGDKIFAQATGQPTIEMLPVSPIEFVLKEINAHITFIKETGKVTKLKLHMNGTDSDLPRME